MHQTDKFKVTAVGQLTRGEVLETRGNILLVAELIDEIPFLPTMILTIHKVRYVGLEQGPASALNHHHLVMQGD